MKNKTMNIISNLIKFLRDKKVIERFRRSSKDFTRKRKLHFARLVILILKGHKLPMQNAINQFFKELGEVAEVATASAYCQARQKLDPEIYKELSKMVVDDFYELYEDDEIKLWKGKRVLAIDGSCINLPNTDDTRECFSITGTRFEKPESDKPVQGLCSVLYDVLNGLVITSELGKKKNESFFIYNNHINYWGKNDIVCLDRGYASYQLLATFISKGIDTVIRFPMKNTFKKVEDFINSDDVDQIIELEVPVHRKKLIAELDLPCKIEVRFVKIKLPGGGLEILGTTLLDKKETTLEELGELYFLRWIEECYFDNLKNIFEIERFSGDNIIIIYQDFYGMIFLSNLESVLTKEANAELEEDSTDKKYTYKVNQSVGYSTLIDYVSELFFSGIRSLEAILSEMKILFKTKTVSIRPGRRYPRKSLTPHQRYKYEKYRKRDIA